MRHDLRARIAPAPRLHLQVATAAVGLGTVAAALVTVPPASSAATRPLVIVTDLQRGHPRPNVVTPPPAVSPSPAAPTTVTATAPATIAPVGLPVTAPPPVSHPVLGDTGQAAATVHLGELIEVRLTGSAPAPWSPPVHGTPLVLQQVSSSSADGGVDVLYRAVRRGSDVITVTQAGLCAALGGVTEAACGAVATRLTVSVL
jgi:hypothetical protein